MAALTEIPLAAEMVEKKVSNKVEEMESQLAAWMEVK